MQHLQDFFNSKQCKIVYWLNIKHLSFLGGLTAFEDFLAETRNFPPFRLVQKNYNKG